MKQDKLSSQVNELPPNDYRLTTIYIVGPTASGKTALSIELAGSLNAEIVCADSQTVRRDMHIGTAKPSESEMQGIPHHLIDIIDPYERYSLARFQKDASIAVNDINGRGKLAIVVGGTGLYVDSLYFNYKLPKLEDPRMDVNYHPNLTNIENTQHLSPFSARSHPVAGCDLAETAEMANNLAGLSADELRGLVVERGLVLPKNHDNPRHLINILLRNGNVGGSQEPTPGSVIVGINPGREVLINRINSRVDKMFEDGLVDEVRSILDKYGKPPKSFDAIGYRIVMGLLDGEITELEAKELFKIADRQYAKRQMSWFGRNKHIVWFESPEATKAYILNL